MQTFSDRLKNSIRNSMLSQKAICEKVGIAEDTMSNYLSGRSYPRFDVLAKLCVLLNISSDWLLGIGTNSQEVNHNDGGISIADRISAQIKELGLSQADVARMTGLSKNAISLYVMGKRTPTQGNLQALADALQVSVPWLLTGVDDSKNPVVDDYVDVRLTRDEFDVIHRMRCGQVPVFDDSRLEPSVEEGQFDEEEIAAIAKLRVLPDDDRQDFYDFLTLKYNRLNAKSKVPRSLCSQNDHHAPESSDSPTGIA